VFLEHVLGASPLVCTGLNKSINIAKRSRQQFDIATKQSYAENMAPSVFSQDDDIDSQEGSSNGKKLKMA